MIWSGSPLARLVSILGFATLVTLPAMAEAQSRIGVVDTQRAIMETEEGLRAQATLKKLFDSKQRELDKKQEDLQKERDDIEKQRKVLSAEAWQKRAEVWQREMAELQAVFLEYNKEIQKKQNELTQPIFQKTLGAIRRIATTEGFDIVVDKQAVPYVRGDMELTDKVIQMVNGGAVPEGTEAKPAADPKKAPAPASPAPAAPIPAAPASAPAR